MDQSTLDLLEAELSTLRQARIRRALLIRQLRRMDREQVAGQCGPNGVWVVPVGRGRFDVPPGFSDVTLRQVVQGLLGGAEESELERARRLV